MTEGSPPAAPAMPAGVDPTVPSSARLYDYFLAGKNNYAADREAAEKMLAVVPEIRMWARADRAFMRRAVDLMCAQGIDQFLDIGAGLPAEGPVHEVARHHYPEARVVYVDHDPVVRVHAEALLADRPDVTGVVEADMRDPEAVFAHPELTRRLDLSRPVGLLLVAMLHFLRDEQEPYALVRRYLEHLPPGSYVAISHGENDTHPDRARFLEELYAATSSPGQIRSIAEIRRFFDDLALLEPGVVHLADWRPTDDEPHYDPDQVWAVGGVGRWDGPAASRKSADAPS
ncbi:SAM-dependent methyltransferase [Streptomonospora litoralis]|uniref:S-adenosyl methyltransferase n=1 Tax=Streptomonospora litoralis TaxID=2498135 RepID=A0A4P6Q867_9ACTN|nr:SAM-dependent methyltransferase [Streptomonospora litoralis]QBI56610.1 S-adenosyl methyltransferase [Streptomonospora litoralis]